jgi:hypothetical protein
MMVLGLVLFRANKLELASFLCLTKAQASLYRRSRRLKLGGMGDGDGP